ncbi:MAG: PEP-CTERM sorting domain-containing protein [Pirellulales bacterium]|nr:PEP-CTERM sorting domain-containing protein [Pirellulales bacterium]
MKHRTSNRARISAWSRGAALAVVATAGQAAQAVTAPYYNDFTSDINDVTTYVQPNDPLADPLVYDGEWVLNTTDGVLKNRTGLAGGSQRTNGAWVDVDNAAGANVTVSTDFKILNTGFSANTTLGLLGMFDGLDPVNGSYYFFDFRPRTGLMRLFEVNSGASNLLASGNLGGLATGVLDILDESTGEFRVFSMSFELLHTTADDGMGGAVPAMHLKGTLTGWAPNGNSNNGDPVDTYTTTIEAIDAVAPLTTGNVFGLRNRGGGNTAVYEVDYLDFAVDVAAAPLAGDFTGDGMVDGDDLTNATSGWQARYGADLDGDDFLVWQRNYGAGVPAAVGVVPEPATLVLAALFVATFALRRRR